MLVQQKFDVIVRMPFVNGFGNDSITLYALQVDGDSITKTDKDDKIEIIYY
jgi:hypothetical protein